MYDPSDILRLIANDGNWIENGRDVKSNNLQLLSLENKKIFTALICHQLARNGYIAENKDLKRFEYIKLYDEVMKGAGDYIESLFDNICQKKWRLHLNMKTFNESVLMKCSDSIIDGFGGYIGYSEWQWLFLDENPRITPFFPILGLNLWGQKCGPQGKPI